MLKALRRAYGKVDELLIIEHLTRCKNKLINSGIEGGTSGRQLDHLIHGLTVFRKVDVLSGQTVHRASSIRGGVRSKSSNGPNLIITSTNYCYAETIAMYCRLESFLILLHERTPMMNGVYLSVMDTEVMSVLNLLHTVSNTKFRCC